MKQNPAQLYPLTSDALEMGQLCKVDIAILGESFNPGVLATCWSWDSCLVATSIPPKLSPDSDCNDPVGTLVHPCDVRCRPTEDRRRCAYIPLISSAMPMAQCLDQVIR